MSESDTEATIGKIVDRLAARYPNHPRPLIAGIVQEEYDSLDQGRIRIYIPTLVENAAKDRLRR